MTAFDRRNAACNGPPGQRCPLQMVSNTGPATPLCHEAYCAGRWSRQAATLDEKFGCADPVRRIVFLRRNISSSKLVRLLGDWAPVDMEASGMDFAQRLGLWISAFDAIGLLAAHQSIGKLTSVLPGKPPGPRKTPAESVTEDFLRVRKVLADLVAMDAAALAAADASYAPYHQRHLKLQREMEQAIVPLRDRVRQTLGRVSSGLRQLSALDAVLEQMIAPREQMLLSKAPTLMLQRFEQLRLGHRQTLEAAGQQDDPALWRQPDGWLAIFGNDWRQALQAELDLRLEPVAGLIEALRNESKNQS